ncbi:MAG: N-succinyldiaminopimelate aminotransferase [Actinomycetota bacterium]|nr:N-succinyldiaminopimelate aminotransferase [Actinomycetota bacterium]
MNPYLVQRLQPFGTTIFAEMSALAVETGAINLGQGFPDTDGPAVMKQAAIDAIEAGYNQYPPGIGIPELRTAISAHQRRFYGLEYDSGTEVLVTAGATEAIAAALLALCGPGDEVVTFEPYYDSYAACIAMSGASRCVVTLRAPDYAFDPDDLRGAITPRTKLILLNSPHNPTGKVFSRAELTLLAELAQEHDLLVVTDEVYEHLVYDGEHVPIATLPDMRDRTVAIGSGGKSFSFTGWKVGWVCARPELVAAVKTAKQFLTYVSSGPFQYAIAVGLALPDHYFTRFRVEMRDKRDRLCAGLAAAGFEVLQPQGTYFATVDIRSFGETDGLAFCRALPHRCGVVAVPSVVFYDDVVAGAPLVRFACCKRTEVLDEACTRLKNLAR